MAVSIKTILLLGVLAAVFSNSHAMKLVKRQVNATARYGYGSKSSEEHKNGAFSCQGYYECMNKMQAKDAQLSSLKSEQATLLATMTSVNKKALDQERMLNKLIPQNKRMRHEMEELNEELEDCMEKSDKYVHQIAVLEAQLARAMSIIEETINMCTEQVGDWDIDRVDSGVYYFDYTNTKSWWEAQNSCREHGMNLVSIDNQDELDYIYDQLEQSSDFTSADAMWIGLNNFETEDDVYKWIGTGLTTTQDTSDGTVDTEDWDTTEPTITNACTVYKYDASAIDLYWYTQDCTTASYYVCELPPICYHLFEIQFSLSDLKL